MTEPVHGDEVETPRPWLGIVVLGLGVVAWLSMAVNSAPSSWSVAEGLGRLTLPVGLSTWGIVLILRRRTTGK